MRIPHHKNGSGCSNKQIVPVVKPIQWSYCLYIPVIRGRKIVIVPYWFQRTCQGAVTENASQKLEHLSKYSWIDDITRTYKMAINICMTCARCSYKVRDRIWNLRHIPKYLNISKCDLLCEHLLIVRNNKL